MKKEVIKIGDKVICLYRKSNYQEGRIHLGFGVVEHMSRCALGPYFFSVKLDRESNIIRLIDSPPYGAVVPFTKELSDKMIDLHNHHLRLVLDIEDDYFKSIGEKQ